MNKINKNAIISAMRILGIETSCDETAMSIIEVASSKKKVVSKDIKVLSNVVSSQVKIHARYGGVVPALAAREHVKNIKHVFGLTLKEASIKDFEKEIDLISVTRGPGLGPALLVGLTFARTIAWLHKKPLIGVNHLEGHIYSNFLAKTGEFSIFNLKFSKKLFPILNLIVSGGHTELVLMKNHGQYKIVGETMDDAVGEAFDKVARLLGLGYPGGPAIAKRASQWNHQSPNIKHQIKLPRPMEKSKNFNFSYSGLKTAVLYLLRDLKANGVKLTENIINEIAHEFQEAATDVLIQKTMRAAKEFKVKSILLSGGVSANRHLRKRLQQSATEAGLQYLQPELEYTGDNAAMIAMAGYFNYLKNKKTDYKSVKMDSNLGFGVFVD